MRARAGVQEVVTSPARLPTVKWDISISLYEEGDHVWFSTAGTAYTIIGAAPGWYKDLDYRARVVRESRTVLREMGLDLPESTEIRVWDTTADTRYMVLPVQPPATQDWPVDKLAAIVTQDSMIGASRLDEVKE